MFILFYSEVDIPGVPIALVICGCSVVMSTGPISLRGGPQVLVIYSGDSRILVMGVLKK